MFAWCHRQPEDLVRRLHGQLEAWQNTRAVDLRVLSDTPTRFETVPQFHQWCGTWMSFIEDFMWQSTLRRDEQA